MARQDIRLAEFLVTPSPNPSNKGKPCPRSGTSPSSRASRPPSSAFATSRYNLWWSWAPVAHELFVRIDPDLWEEVHGNPIELLARVDQARLDELATDDAFTSHLEAAWQTFQRYMQREGWFSQTFPEAAGARIAYFSMEYGIHECLPIYSGGLGVLAGDHLKTASDLGLPLVGVGPRVRRGVLPPGAQRRRLAGRALPDQRLAPHAGARRSSTARASASSSTCSTRTAIVHAQLWKVQVGRVPLYLLDANLEENAPADRSITGPLYGGDQEFRVRQEIMLGIGGMHALEALGLSPTVCHMNEGHSAFLALERIGRVMRERGVSVRTSRARRTAPATSSRRTRPSPPATTPSTRTSCAATSSRTARRSGISRGRPPRRSAASTRATRRAPFSMPVLAIRTSDHYNGVSELHGEVSRKMWQGLWPDLPDARDPDRVDHQRRPHARRGSRREMGALFTRYLGPRWAEQLRRRRSSGSARTRSPTPSSGRSTSTGATASCSTRAAGCARPPSGAAPRARSSSSPTRCSTRTR